MMITKIKTSKFNQIMLYSEEGCIISLPLEVFKKSGLKIGLEITQEDINNIKLIFQEHKAKEKALNILSYRSHSRNELKNKIKSRFGEQCAQNVVDKIENLGLLNDEKFAEDYAIELMKNKYYSKKRIKFELIKKNISSDIINNILEKLNIDEHENLIKIVNKRNFLDLKDRREIARAVNYLYRLGYDLEQINNVLNI